MAGVGFAELSPAPGSHCRLGEEGDVPKIAWDTSSSGSVGRGGPNRAFHNYCHETSTHVAYLAIGGDGMVCRYPDAAAHERDRLVRVVVVRYGRAASACSAVPVRRSASVQSRAAVAVSRARRGGRTTIVGPTSPNRPPGR